MAGNIETTPGSSISVGNINPGGDVAGNVSSGLELGMRLAQQKQNVETQRQNLEEKKQLHLTQAYEKQIDLATKVGKLKGPAQKMVAGYFNRLAAITKTPLMDADLLTAANANPDEWAYVHSRLQTDPEARKDPALMAKFRGLYAEPAEADKALQEIISDFTKRDNAKIIAASQANTAESRLAVADINARERAATAEAKRKQTYIQAGISPQAESDQFIAQNEAGRIGSQKIAESAAKVSSAEATTDLKAAQTKAVPINTESNRIKAKAIADRVGIAGANLGLREQGLLLRGDAHIKNDKIIKDTSDILSSLSNANAVLANPNIKWADMTEVVKAHNRAITGSSRIAQSSEDKLELKSFQRTLDRAESYIRNKETGGPSPEEVQIWKERVARLKDRATETHDAKVEAIGKNLKDMIPAYKQKFIDTYKLAPAQVPAQAATSATTTGQLKPVPPEKLQQLKSIFKGDQTRLLKFLQDHNFDAKGIQ